MSQTNLNLRQNAPECFPSAYSPKTRVSLIFPIDSRFTKQSHKDECDINTIMARYNRTGDMPVINELSPQYFDCTGIEYESNMQFVAEANQLFMALPSHLRNRFQNDPAQFLDFTSNPENEYEMAELGLFNPERTKQILTKTPPEAPKPATPE